MTVQPVPFTPPPFQSGPEWGGPAGYQNFVIPAAANSLVVGGSTVITLKLPSLLEWFSKYIVPQQVFGFFADAAATGPIYIKVNGVTYPAYLNTAQANGSNINAKDYCQVAYDQALNSGDGGFHLLNWSQLGSGGGSTGNQIIGVAAGPYTVAANTSALILNQGAPQVSTAINLGSVVNRNGLPLVISDAAAGGGMAGDMIITPNGAETIMGGASYTIGQGGSATFYPNAALGGWFKGD